MATQIFVNLPVKDLKKSIAFFSQIGFTFNQQFTDDTAACMVISDHIYAMLLTHEKFSQFTPKKIADTSQSTEVLNALSFDSKEKVNEAVDKAIGAGATEAREPIDYGFMYGRSFNDLDGHIWEFFWMDPATVQQEQPVHETSLN